MKSRFGSYVCACIFAVFNALLGATSYAQEKYSYNHSSPPETSRYIRDHSIDVDDVPGHKVRVVEIQRIYTKDHPVIMGTKVLETWFRGFTDYIGSAGPGHGYDTWIMEDGNKLFLESIFLSTTEPTATGSRRGTSHATLRFVGGTGKFSSIQGTLTSSTEFDTDPKSGYNRPKGRGEYWFVTQ
jgi:hypothetical protein